MDEITLQFINYWILTPISLLFRGVLFALVFVLARRLWVFRLKLNKVAVVVLGDIGRSPRMQYHSLSLAKHGFSVKLVGYAGSLPHYNVIDCGKITMHFVKEAETFPGTPKILSYVLKVVIQSVYLTWTLLVKAGATQFILLQNPPCIPSLAVCWLLSVFNGSKLIIDWHNYGYSILGLSLGRSHLLVKIAKWYEETFGQLSCGNLCVTKAMQKDMMQRWNISADVMHDRPASIFKMLTNKEKHLLFTKLATTYEQFQSSDLKSDCTRFTSYKDGEVSFKECRPALLVSSTSWTEDEDFSILLEALENYEVQIEKSNATLPDILCAITGKGPQKAYYQKIISSKKWTHVGIITPWLEAEDYPKLLACADLGVCLHTSSSGLDLPMKVVDMFGSGLPVAAIKFSCLDELVQHDVNGLVFNDASQLSEQLQSVLNRFPWEQKMLSRLRKNVEDFRNASWSDSWDRIVLPMFEK